jgi:tetratricopeptide (TPR) repeat protein
MRVSTIQAGSGSLRSPLAVIGIVLALAAPSLAQTLAEANTQLLSGRYEEARESFEKLAQENAVASALGIARCDAAVGKYDEAMARLKAAADASLKAELAALSFDRGDYAAAQEHADKALELDKNNAPARWTLAELHRVHGRLDDALKGYEWFVDYYNDAKEIKDPDALRYVGLGAAQYARWKRNASQFRFLVNKLYPQALKLEKNYWPANLEAGLLFLEKYNDRDATTELNAALAINPNSAEVHAARAKLALQDFELDRAITSLDRAIEINPNLLAAQQLRADALMADFRTADAIAVLETARQLNPRSETTLGRIAAAYGYADGLNRDEATLKNSRMQKVIDEAVAANPHCGEFFFTLGETFDLLRKYPHAAKYYEESLTRMPQLIASRGQLGMVCMRLGEEAKAKTLLAESFKIDPFNVRIKNSLAVLDVLEGYAEIETEHFIIRFDRGRDQMLAEYAARYLEEEVYPQIVKDLGYAPQGKSLFEIFSRAKSTSGHGWFSARMVGLPSIGTVGACAGRMVAMVSPADMPQPFNWARVLKHEFVHVVNLQQTDFNIPHWFTEALAVRLEGFPRPPDWTALLARRHAAGTLFTLADINHGFLRPGAGDDWTLAYCQAEIYAEYMVERFGEDALAKMLAAYAENLGTPAAIEKCFVVKVDEFEKGYLEHVARLVAGVPASQAKARTLAELEAAVKASPADADAQAELAAAQLKRENNREAREAAKKALEQDAKHPLASFVMARLQLSIGDDEAATKYLADSLDENRLVEEHLALLAALESRAGNADETERLLKLGAKQFSHGDAWQKRLAAHYLKTKDDEKLQPILEQLADLDHDNLAFRQKLAQLALARQDFAAAERWAMAALSINIQDAALHALRADALAELKQHAEAAKEYAYALQLDGEQIPWRLALAKAHASAGDKEAARLVLEQLLQKSPDYPGAKELLEELKDD